MKLDLLREFFLWCSVINMGLLLFSFVFIIVVRDFACRMHQKIFKLTEDQFHVTMYRVIAYYKMGIFLFCIIPYCALCIITCGA